MIVYRNGIPYEYTGRPGRPGRLKLAISPLAKKVLENEARRSGNYRNRVHSSKTRLGA